MKSTMDVEVTDELIGGGTILVEGRSVIGSRTPLIPGDRAAGGFAVVPLPWPSRAARPGVAGPLLRGRSARAGVAWGGG